jgi:hypothetical protein
LWKAGRRQKGPEFIVENKQENGVDPEILSPS